MSSTALERVVRPYSSPSQQTGNVFEVSQVAKDTTTPNVGILKISARTSVRTTDVKGVGYKIVFKNPTVEISRTEQTVTITDPDNPDNKLQTKVPRELAMKDGQTGQVLRQVFAVPTADGTGTIPATSSSDSSGDWAVENTGGVQGTVQ